MAQATISLRNTLWLTAALAMVAAPHAERLPWWVIMLAVMLVLWRIYLGRARLALPRSWLTLMIVAGATAGIYLTYRTIFGRDAGIALLIVMLALKLLETRSQRDGMLLTFLGYFLVITNFLYSQTVPTALYMVACVWIITSAMIGLNHMPPPRGYRNQLRTAGLMLAQSAPLMLVLFIFFPRVQGPLWGLPSDAYSSVSGLSDTMSPGSLIDLSLSDAVAFRVKFKSAVPEGKFLYWRGPVMWDFDGHSWTTPRANRYGEPKFDATSPPVEYTVTLEPHNQRWLFALDLPGRVPPRALATTDLQLRAIAPVTNRMRYEMTSFLNYSYGLGESRSTLDRALRLPPGANPRTIDFASALRQKFPDSKALMREVLLMFRNEKFFYTLSPPPLGEHAVDEFLFQTRSGFCEHYASAFAVLMRASGIPARVVTGYQGGEVNPVGNYMIVRQADAHAWTEVWFRDEGWVRVDPTAAVSPLRVESGIATALPDSASLPLMVRGGYSLLHKLRLNWDSLANSWNQWVLGYNPERQQQLLARAGIDDATWRTLAVILIVTTGLIMLGLSLFMLRRLRTAVHDPVKRAYLRFCRKLERKGLPRDPAEGPGDYAARLAALRPDLAPAVAAITRLYIALRYGASPDAAAVHRLQRQVRQFSM
jgi:transglutaminase-like putative cysteine protease